MSVTALIMWAYLVEQVWCSGNKLFPVRFSYSYRLLAERRVLNAMKHN